MSTKKVEQRRIKEEKQAAAQRKQKLSGMATKIAFGILIPLVVVVLLYGLFSGSAAVPPDQVSTADHVRGDANAPVIITMYADFQCPACLTEADIMSRAWREISSNARLVFRHYPLDTHRHAFTAARYAEAAARQDRFWEMHDVLFGNQTLWQGEADATTLFDGYAEQLGLDMEQLRADLEDPLIREKIIADQRGGTRAGVRSTPSLFINGRLVTNNPRSATELVALVDRAARGE
jgi:protein-disulfide isomerase